jgi:hypothetical protein
MIMGMLPLVRNHGKEGSKDVGKIDINDMIESTTIFNFCSHYMPWWEIINSLVCDVKEAYQEFSPARIPRRASTTPRLTLHNNTICSSKQRQTVVDQLETQPPRFSPLD